MGLLDRDYMREKPILRGDDKQMFDVLDTSLCPKGNKLLNCYEHRISYLVNTNDPYTWDCPLCREAKAKMPKLSSVSIKSGPRDLKKMMSVIKEMADSDRGEQLRDVLPVIAHKLNDAWRNGRRDMSLTDQERWAWIELMMKYNERPVKMRRWFPKH